MITIWKQIPSCLRVNTMRPDWTNGTTFCRWHFHKHFLWQKLFYFASNFTKLYWQYIEIDSGNALWQNKWQVITWTTAKSLIYKLWSHDDSIICKHFPRYWPFVQGIHWSPVNSSHKGQWRGALMFSLICAWTNSWVNNRDAGDLRCHHAHYNVTVMTQVSNPLLSFLTHWGRVTHICIVELGHHRFR